MAKEEKPEGSGIDYSAREGQPARDIEIRPDNPFSLTASNQFDNRDGALYSPGTSQQVLDAQQRQWNINTAYDSFSEAKYPGGQYGPPDATADFGLSVADRASDAKYGGVLSDEQYGYWQTSEAARNPDSTLISEDELRYYGSGGVDGWDVALEQYGVPDNLGGTLRDALISQVESERDTGTRFAWLARNAPAAVAAIGANGMDPDDVATAHNVYVAQQAANRAVEMVDEGLPMAAAQLMNVLPVQQRIIASALLHSEIQKREQAAAEQQAQVDEDARQQSLKPQFNPATGQLSTPSVTPTGGVVGSTGTSSAVSGMDILNWLLEATLWGVETVTHVARFYGTTANTALFEGGEFGGVVTPASGEQQITDSFASRIGAMWQATEENFISRNGYDEMVAEFGKDTADLAMGLYDAERSDDPDAVEKYKASLASNPQAVASIQAALSGNNIGNSPLAEAMVQLYAKDQGNYGNLIAGMVGLEPGTIPFSMARDAVNVASWFAFDPLVWAGMAGKAFRASKYGLQVIEQMGGMGNVLRASRLGPWAERAVLGRVTGFNGVRAEYDEFGQALKAYQEAVDVGDTAKAAAILKNARKRWMGKRNSLLGEADWNVGKEHKLYSADEWATHFDDIDKAGEILAGKRVALEQPVSTMDEAFGQINKAMKPTPDEEVLAHEGMGMAVKSAVGQQVRRQLYMPHVTQAQAMLRAQTIAWGKTVAPAYIDRAVQALERTIQVDGWEYMNVEGKMNALRNLISNDEAVAKALGLELGDWKLIDGQMQRTVLGRFADRLYDHGEGARRVGMILGLFKRSKSKDGVQYLKVKGWKRDRTLFDVPGRARGARETWARLVTRLPNLPHGLNVSSAEHADEVYRMAMAAGLGRGGSNLIRLAWVEGNAASRQNMMIGLTRTFTAAMGLDAVDPHLATRVMREMTGLRAKEEYAANAIPNEAGTRATIREEVEWMNGQRRAEVMGRERPQQAEIDEIEATLRGAGNGGKARSARQRETDIDVEEIQSIIDNDSALQALLKQAEESIGDVEKFTELSARADARQRYLIEQWIRTSLEDERLLKLWLKRSGGAPSPKPLRGSQDWQWFVDENPLDESFRARSPGGGVDFDPQMPSGLSNNQEAVWNAHGAVPVKWAEENFTVENFWSWLHTGNDDAHRLAGFTDEFGYPPKSWLEIEEMSRTYGKGRVRYVEVPWMRHTNDNYVEWARATADDITEQSIIEATRQPLAFQAFLNETPFVRTTRGGVAQLTEREVKALRGRAKKLRQEIRKEDRRLLKGIDDDADYARAIAEEQKPGGRLHAATMSVNPSVDGNGKASALYMGQTSDYMAVPNIKAMDQYAARQSYLNGFLFQGTAGTNVTEAWVLGSLYGPRFAIRNAFEDIAMYVLTGGKMGKFFKGRRLDEAIDESMARVNKNYLAHKQRADNAQKEFDRVSAEFRAGRADPNQLVLAKQENDVAQTLLAQAQNERTLFGASKYGQHKKRGIVRTAILNISERLSWTPAGRERDGVVASMARLLAPTTSTAARREALEKGPEAMIELAEKAVLRQNVVWNRPGWRKIVPARAEKVEDLTPRQLQYLRDEEDFLRSSHGLTYKDMAAESAAHLMDGSIPTLTNGGRYVFDERGNLMRRISVDEGYQSVKINSNVLSPQQARGMMARLGYMADKYGLNQAAMHQLPDYWKALNAVGGPDVKALDDIVEIVLGVAQQSRDWPYVASRFRLADDLGAKAHVRRMMDDMSAAFTRRGTGSEKDVMELWNQDLWISLRHTRNGKITFGLEKPSGEPAITEIDFLLGKYDTPASVLVHGSEGWVDVPAKDMWSSAAWEQMGRSMSRMSRNPIFYSNYLESRQAMRPLERKYAEIFGEEYARKKFADAAAERAYELTMSFVDNPAIRTNLSWQVRNIARYYRAQEDFVRRVTRMVKFDPVSIQKANLAWQAQQDFGFVHRDDFGNDYFMYPGSAAVMSVFQSFFGLIGVDNLKVAHAPMAFSGNVQWLSPSLDLGAAAPTLSSPWMAVTLQPLLRSMPFANDWFKAVERYAFGDVSSNMDYTDLNLGDGPAENVAAAFYQTLPPSVKKLIAIGEGAFGNELPGSFGYKMTAKTMVAMAAAGQLPSQRDIADETKRQEWLDLMGRRTFEMSILSFVFGFFAPASPQYTEDTLSFSAREQGLTMLAPGLREGIMASVKAGMSWEEAYITWMRANPKQAGVLVSSSESIGGSYVEATWNNVDFIESNRALFDEAPLGVTFFVPDSQGAGGGEEGNAAWRAMKQFGLRQYREMQPFADDILMAQGRLEKMILDSQIGDMEAEIPHYDANGEITDVWRRHEEEKDRAKDRLNALYPSSDQGYELTDSDEYRVTADQIVTANRGLAGKSPMARAASPLVEAFTQLRYDYNQFLTGGGPSGIGRDDMKENFKAEWQRVVAAWWADAAGRYPQDRAEKMVSVFSRSLSTGWKDITLEGEQ